MNQTCKAAHSLDPTDSNSLTYWDNLRLLAAKSEGEEIPPDLSEKEVTPLKNVSMEVHNGPEECSQILGITISSNDNDIDDTVVEEGKQNRTTTQTIHLGHITSIIPFMDQDFHLDVAASATLAIHHFNTRNPSILGQQQQQSSSSSTCSIRLTHEFFDSEQNPITASRIFLNEIRPRKRHFLSTREIKQNQTTTIDRQVARPYPTAIIGALKSDTTESLVTLTGIYKSLQISHATTAPKFDDKTIFPFFGRIIPSSDGHTQVALDLIHNYLGSSFAGLIYQKGPIGDSYANAMQEAALQTNLKLRVVPIGQDNSHLHFHKSMTEAVSKLEKTKYNIFIAIIEPSNYEPLMEEAYKQGIAGPGFLWLFASIPNRFFNNKKYPTGSPLALATHGIGLINIGVPKDIYGQTSVLDRFLKEWKTLNEPEFKEYFKSKQPRFDQTQSFHKVDHYDFPEIPSWDSFFMYDAVMSIGLAACKLEQLNSSPHFSQADLFETFKSNTFEGITGSIAMNKYASREVTTATYYVTNVVANQPDSDGMVSFSLHEPLIHSASINDGSKNPQSSHFEKAETSTWVQLKDQSAFIYSSSTTSPPIPIRAPDIVITSISRSAQLVGLSIGVVPVLTSIFFFIWTLRNKSSRVVRSNQPFFLYFVCLGCLIMSLAIIPMSLKDPSLGECILGASCKSGPWFFVIGFSLTITALHAKTSRLNTILTRNPLVRLPLSSKRAMLKECVFLLINIIVLTIWTITTTGGHELLEGYEKDEFGRTIEFFSGCNLTNRSNDAFLIVLFLLNMVSLLATLYQANRTKHLVIGFSEGKYIFFIVYFIMEIWILGAVTVFTSRRYPDTFFLANSWIQSICSTTILSLVFVPIIYACKRMDSQSSDGDDLRSLFISISEYRISEEASAAHSIRSLDIADTPEDESDITN